MAIVLNGSTGITTPDIDSTAGFDAADITGTISTAQIADANVTTAKIADVNVTQGKLADQAVNEAKLQVSNAPTNGYALTAQSGNTGGMTWAEVGGGSMVFIASSGAISNAATVAFTAFDASAFDHYVFMMQHVIPATDGVQLFCQTSTDGGSNFATTSGDYHNAGGNDKVGLMVMEIAVGSDTDEDGVSGKFEIYAPHVANRRTTAQALCIVSGTDAGSNILNSSFGQKRASHRFAEETNNAVRFIFESGNIESGEIVMYGIANA